MGTHSLVEFLSKFSLVEDNSAIRQYGRRNVAHAAQSTNIQIHKMTEC